MSFSSLLPAPLHSGTRSSQNQRNRHKEESKVNALLKDEDNNINDDEPNEIDVIHRQIASNVKFEDFIPLRQRNFAMEIPLPTEDAIRQTKEKTLAFLNRLQRDDSKSSGNIIGKKTDATIMKIGNRSVKVVTPVQDPLQPSRFKRTGKIYTPNVNQDKGPTTILHDLSSTTNPGKAISAEERSKWKIPTFVSQWKNPNGYTVDRVTGNGEGSGIKDINSGFSELSEALEDADRKAKQHLQEKNEAKRIAYENEVAEKEARLKELANRRRYNGSHNNEPLRIEKPTTPSHVNNKKSNDNKSNGILIQKLRNIAKQEGRDISEKIILGTAKATAVPEMNYDSRLYMKGAQSSARRHGEQLYDNPLFAQQDIESIYRTNYNKLDDQIETESGEGDIMNKVNKETGNMNRGPIEFTKAIAKEDEKNKTNKPGLQK
ncbi:similar to Saccharomyces cerevisiae YAL032C PRP45 Protein required for pre-mRNA splicing [Maudiozyma saulgeensis]|uniref:Pre-mRNA-processing protein 45 n=1 Tax=Maudiozyma saulgeensis TaxID=1789683 RepID=A0A1X7R7A8_9SACH|nr:similar to Saccharomyces cerevisiae YAL032C PRP45 Protein required for pre-mRNA splicing [Kazachstania saulgeensis]